MIPDLEVAVTARTRLTVFLQTASRGPVQARGSGPGAGIQKTSAPSKAHERQECSAEGGQSIRRKSKRLGVRVELGGGITLGGRTVPISSRARRRPRSSGLPQMKQVGDVPSRAGPSPAGNVLRKDLVEARARKRPEAGHQMKASHAALRVEVRSTSVRCPRPPAAPPG